MFCSTLQSRKCFVEHPVVNSFKTLLSGVSRMVGMFSEGKTPGHLRAILPGFEIWVLRLYAQIKRFQQHIAFWTRATLPRQVYFLKCMVVGCSIKRITNFLDKFSLLKASQLGTPCQTWRNIVKLAVGFVIGKFKVTRSAVCQGLLTPRRPCFLHVKRYMRSAVSVADHA